MFRIRIFRRFLPRFGSIHCIRISVRLHENANATSCQALELITADNNPIESVNFCFFFSSAGPNTIETDRIDEKHRIVICVRLINRPTRKGEAKKNEIKNRNGSECELRRVSFLFYFAFTRFSTHKKKYARTEKCVEDNSQ